MNNSNRRSSKDFEPIKYPDQPFRRAAERLLAGSGAVALAIVLAGCAPARNSQPRSKPQTPITTTSTPIRNTTPTTTESMPSLEQTNDPEAFISMVDVRLQDIANKIKASPALKTGANVLEGDNYYIVAPSPKKPGKSVLLGVGFLPGQEKPIAMGIEDGLTSSTLKKILGSGNNVAADTGYVLQHSGGGKFSSKYDSNFLFGGHFTVHPNATEIEDILTGTFYSVSTKLHIPEFNQTMPAFGKITDVSSKHFNPTNPTEVARGYTQILDYADQILAEVNG